MLSSKSQTTGKPVESGSVAPSSYIPCFQNGVLISILCRHPSRGDATATLQATCMADPARASVVDATVATNAPPTQELYVIFELAVSDGPSIPTLLLC